MSQFEYHLGVEKKKKLSRGEGAKRKSEACGVCLTGTCLHRPAPFQFKRPLSHEQQLKHYSLWRGKKNNTFTPLLFFLYSLLSSLRLEQGAVDPSRTPCCKGFIICLNFNYFPALLSPRAEVEHLLWRQKEVKWQRLGVTTQDDKIFH